jgi:hypothetical protein
LTTAEEGGRRKLRMQTRKGENGREGRKRQEEQERIDKESGRESRRGVKRGRSENVDG